MGQIQDFYLWKLVFINQFTPFFFVLILAAERQTVVWLLLSQTGSLIFHQPSPLLCSGYHHSLPSSPYSSSAGPDGQRLPSSGTLSSEYLNQGGSKKLLLVICNTAGSGQQAVRWAATQLLFFIFVDWPVVVFYTYSLNDLKHGLSTFSHIFLWCTVCVNRVSQFLLGFLKAHKPC